MKKMMRRFIAVSAVCLLAATVSGVRAQSLKIGVFDPQRLSEATQMGKQLQSRLSDFQSEKQTDIESKRSEIMALQEQLRTQELSLSSGTRTRMEKQIQRQMLALEAAQQLSTQEMQLELAAAKQEFEERLYQAVESFGRNEGFSVILDRSLVAWADNTVDVTSALVDLFDQMFPGSDGSAN